MNPAQPTDGVPSTTTGQVSHWLGQAAQIVSGISGFSYAFGWVLTARFFGSFGVNPEDAGVSFSWLAIRAFLVGITGLAIFLIARSLLQAAERSEPVVHVIQSRAAIIVLTVVCCIGVAALVALSLTGWVASSGGTVGTAPVVAVLASGTFTAVIILWLRPPSVQLGWNSSLWLRGIAGALLGFVAVSLLLMPYRLGDYLADEVRNGQATHLPVVPGVPALQITQVSLSLGGQPGSATNLLPPVNCVLRLGGNSGTSIYYANGRVLRVADENATVAAPC
jgi:hypothetical protein